MLAKIQCRICIMIISLSIFISYFGSHFQKYIKWNVCCWITEIIVEWKTCTKMKEREIEEKKNIADQLRLKTKFVHSHTPTDLTYTQQKKNQLYFFHLVVSVFVCMTIKTIFKYTHPLCCVCMYLIQYRCYLIP